MQKPLHGKELNLAQKPGRSQYPLSRVQRAWGDEKGEQAAGDTGAFM